MAQAGTPRTPHPGDRGKARLAPHDLGVGHDHGRLVRLMPPVVGGRASERKVGTLRADIREALAIGASTPLGQRTIDITTTGRRTGLPRRIEIVFYRFGDSVYLSGVPSPRPRDWLLNLKAEPNFIFHLKSGVVADLQALATVITDPGERRRILARFVEEFNERNGPQSPWPQAVLEEWVTASPLARVDFVDQSDR
jgi:deazaflavin-dependent oxidoreductase (nitroreductase family)